MWWKSELSFFTITLALFLFGCHEMGCSNSLWASLFIGDECDFLQEWVRNVNKWVIFTKFFITLTFNFLSGMCKSQDQRNQSQIFVKCSTTSYAYLGMHSSIFQVFKFSCLLECEPWTDLSYWGISNHQQAWWNRNMIMINI